jgi:hypothetical protein
MLCFGLPSGCYSQGFEEWEEQSKTAHLGSSDDCFLGQHVYRFSEEDLLCYPSPCPVYIVKER